MQHIQNLFDPVTLVSIPDRDLKLLTSVKQGGESRFFYWKNKNQLVENIDQLNILGDVLLLFKLMFSSR